MNGTELKITADGDCSHEIKRYLLLGRKVMTNLDSIFKSFRMDWLDLLEVQGLSRVFSNTTVQKHQFFSA